MIERFINNVRYLGNLLGKSSESKKEMRHLILLKMLEG